MSSLVRNVPFLTSIEVAPFSSPTQSAVFGFFLQPKRRRWESGKPAFGFPLFHRLVAGAVGMWESRGFCEISKERREEGKSCFWICTLSTTPPFPQLFFSRSCPPSCLHLSITFSPRMVRLRRRRHPSRLSRSGGRRVDSRSEEHTSEIQSLRQLVCRLF